jgi:hypothetical protein
VQEQPIARDAALPSTFGDEPPPRAAPALDPARLSELVRRRWERLDWAAAIPADALVIPEAHYMDVAALGLSDPQRAALNRLFACFTCELFVHFEAYVIRYLVRVAESVKGVSRPGIERFIAEERVHSEAFRRLLHKLRPDLYPDDASERLPLRFLRWGRGDDAALRLVPMGTFFLLAWLFEEITLFVPRALDGCPQQCAPLVSDVMRLHAREEQPHVAIDERVLVHLTRHSRSFRSGLQTVLALPLLVYVDTKVRGAWRQLAATAAREIGLTPVQLARIRDRGPTQSDRWGLQSFVEKLAPSGIAGARLLCWVLQRELRAPRSAAA